VVVCDDCETPRRCADCDVSLTHHRSIRALVCHHCDRKELFDAPCAACGSRAMKPYGAGTERVSSEIQESVVDARVLRLDRDVTARAGALDEVLARFRTGDADVLVGTQMVTKGHDFPGVTLVGIICADASLAFPDFRAAERSFQLLTQVAGRAGRASRPGRVLVQTFQPKHYALTCAIDHDDDRFFALELAGREKGRYPPFSRLGLIRVESEDDRLCREITGRAARVARDAARAIEDARVRGPAPAPIERIRGKHRHRVMVLAPTPARLVQIMRSVQAQLGRPPSKVDLIFDVDAIDLL